MSKLVVYMSMSLDGYIAAEGDDRPGLGLGIGGEPLHAWLSPDARDPVSDNPEHHANAEVLAEMLNTGAVIAGQRFLKLVDYWGGDHHDNVPIFVLTHDVPQEKTRGNLHFVDDPVSAVSQAKEAAGDRDVMMHGAATAQAMLTLGLVDELAITVAPLLLGRGRRLFDSLPGPPAHLRLLRAVQGQEAMHLRYEVQDRWGHT